MQLRSTSLLSPHLFYMQGGCLRLSALKALSHPFLARTQCFSTLHGPGLPPPWACHTRQLLPHSFSTALHQLLWLASFPRQDPPRVSCTTSTGPFGLHLAAGQEKAAGEAIPPQWPRWCLQRQRWVCRRARCGMPPAAAPPTPSRIGRTCRPCLGQAGFGRATASTSWDRAMSRRGRARATSQGRRAMLWQAQ